MLDPTGKPTVTICTDRFEVLALATAKNIGMPGLPLVIVPHPPGGLKPEEVIQKADTIIEDMIARPLENKGRNASKRSPGL